MDVDFGREFRAFFVSGCRALSKKHEANHIPQFGTVDANQPGELRKVSQSAYIIEPPDELEIAAQPRRPTWGSPRLSFRPTATSISGSPGMPTCRG